MRNVILALVAVLAASTVLPSDAEAKRRGGFFYIPGLSESIVFVKDLPDIPALKRSSGEYVDLGYKFGYFGSGEWVGHLGSDTKYLPLKPLQLQLLLAAGGMSKPPEVPSRPGGTFWMILLGILFVVGILGILKKIVGGGGARSSRYAAQPAQAPSGMPVPQAMPQMPAQPGQPAATQWTQGADQAIAAMAAARAAQAAHQPAAAPAGFGQRPAPPRMAAAGAARPHFGHR